MEKTTSVHTKDKHSQYLKRNIENYIPSTRFSFLSTELGIFFANKVLSLAQPSAKTVSKSSQSQLHPPKLDTLTEELLFRITPDFTTENSTDDLCVMGDILEKQDNTDSEKDEDQHERVSSPIKTDEEIDSGKDGDQLKRVGPTVKTDEDYFDEVTRIIQNLIDRDDEIPDDEICGETPEVEPIGKDFSLWLDKFRENQKEEDSVYDEMFSALHRVLRLDDLCSKDIVEMEVPETPIKTALGVIQEILANREDSKFTILKDDVDAVIHLFQTILADNPSYTLDNLIDKSIDMALAELSEDL